MRSLSALSILMLTLSAPLPAAAQPFELSGKWYSSKWTPNTWDGQHRLPGVYCLTFPDPSVAIEMGHGFYNKGAIYLTQVLYPEKVGAFIVASRRSPDRKSEDEFSRLLSIERSAEAAYGVSYNIKEGQSDFGPTINLTIKNVAPESRNGPFPLVRALYGQSPMPIKSMSAHRIFIRGLDRFEIATFQLAQTPPTENDEVEMSNRLSALADRLVKSLYSCTNSLPIRTHQ